MYLFVVLNGVIKIGENLKVNSLTWNLNNAQFKKSSYVHYDQSNIFYLVEKIYIFTLFHCIIVFIQAVSKKGESSTIKKTDNFNTEEKDEDICDIINFIETSETKSLSQEEENTTEGMFKI